MRYFQRLILLFVLLAIFFSACRTKSSDEALLYNNQIVSIQDRLTADIDTFMQSISYPDVNTAALYQAALKTTQAVSDSLKSIKQFEGGTLLFLQTQKYISICESSLKNEGAKIVLLKAQLSLQYSQEQLNQINSYSDSIFNKINDVSLEFDKVQHEFAAKYQFEINQE